MPFLHGVETIEVQSGPRTVRVVKSGVIALIGTAPVGPTQALTLVTNTTDAAQFGPPLPGFTLAKALDMILSQGGGPVVVVNIYNASSHLVTETGESQTIANAKIKLAYAPISNLSILAGSTPLVAGTDYSIDSYGNVKILNASTYADGTVLTCGYKRLSPSLVVASDFVGAIDGTTNARTGLKLYDLCKATFGFKPKLFLAPWYSHISGVAAALSTAADNFKAYYATDAAYGTIPSAALTNRGPAASSPFNTSSRRAILCYNYVKRYDIATNSNEDRPLSIDVMARISATDNDEAKGFWTSFSNQEVIGATGVERILSWDTGATNTEANALNEKGIVTAIKGYGTGVLIWGNRSAAFPNSSTADNFVSVGRTRDIVHESLEEASLQFLDKMGVTQAAIDTIRDTGNAFVNTLIGRGALLPGSKVVFDKGRNPDTQMANGQLVFTLIATPPSPLERITFESYLDISLYSNLK